MNKRVLQQLDDAEQRLYVARSVQKECMARWHRFERAIAARKQSRDQQLQVLHLVRESLIQWKKCGYSDASLVRDAIGLLKEAIHDAHP